MDCYYYFLNHRTTSELVSEVTLTLYNNIHILLAMTDSDTELQEEMKELSVQEAETGPSTSTPSGDRAPTPIWGTGVNPRLVWERNARRLQKWSRRVQPPPPAPNP